jgi:hypothetical protein
MLSALGMAQMLYDDIFHDPNHIYFVIASICRRTPLSGRKDRLLESHTLPVRNVVR